MLNKGCKKQQECSAEASLASVVLFLQAFCLLLKQPLFGSGSCLSRFINKGFALVYKKLIFEKNKRKMSTAYKIAEKEAVSFLSFQVVAWGNIFTRKIYRDIVIDSFENNLNDGKAT